MKTKMRIAGLLMIIIFAGTTLIAQEQKKDDPKQKKENRKQMNEERKKKIESQKVAFIATQINLTTEEAQTFWPVYNEYQAKKAELTKTFRGNNKDKKKIDELSDQEAGKMADDMIINEQKMLDLKKEYHSKFKSVLPIKKVVKLYDSEKQFRKVLLKQVREQKRANKPNNGQKKKVE
ncbi:MAG: hypothetical protein HXX09_06350 [Bacteroidetes bacterium]|nr:hypothetical protein [Bacteroidota bacterium]